MLYPHGRFATLRGVKAVVDDNGEPVFRSSGHSALFLADIKGERCSLRFFTRHTDKVYDDILKDELIWDNGCRLDVVIEPPFVVEQRTHRDVEQYFEGRAIVERDGKFGFIDHNKSIIIEPKYDHVENFGEGRSVVVYGGLYGLIDIVGNEVIAPFWDDLSYDGSMCYVERDGLCGVVDRMGKIISEPVWDWTGEYCQGMLIVKKDNKYGFLDITGRVAIDIKYDDTTSFDANKYATVTLGSRQYQIDTQENRV